MLNLCPKNEILGTRLRVTIQLHAERTTDEPRPNATAKRHNVIGEARAASVRPELLRASSADAVLKAFTIFGAHCAHE